jgi:hypothetical protein
MSLPARARRRWRLEDGGTIAVLDLGAVIVLVPGGIERARRSLIDAIPDAAWSDARDGFGDTDLSNV